MRAFSALFLVLLGSTLLSASCLADSTSLRGLVRERGTKNILSHVNVYLIPDGGTPLQAETNDRGEFTIALENPTPGKYHWVINLAGFERLDQDENLDPAKVQEEREFFVLRNSYSVYETTIYSQEQKRDDKTKSLTQDQFISAAGTGGDPVKAVQNLPGVSRAPFASAQVIIEGSAPDDTNYTIDNMPVPNIFHFGGLSSVVMPEAVDHVDYLSSGFGPEFGQSIAGYVNLYPRDPKTDRLHGLAYLDFYNTGAMVEGPIDDKSSFLIGARQSYIGAVLSLVAKNNSDFNLTTAPDFQDLIGVYKNEVTPIDEFRLVTSGSLDTLSFVLNAPVNQDPAFRGTFDNLTGFVRVIPEWTHHHSQRTISRFWLGFGRDWFRFDTSVNYFAYSNYTFSPRYELEQQINESWKSYVGVDSLLQWSHLNFLAPVIYQQGGVINPISSSQTIQTDNKYAAANVGAWWRNIIHQSDSPWTVIPGIRFDYYNLTNELAPQPRLAARYALPTGWTLRSATGLYFESPQDQQLDANYGNPDLKSNRAIHFTVGAEKDFRAGAAEGITASSDVFYKYLYNLVENSTAYVNRGGNLVPALYDNSGIGHAYGIEFLVKANYRDWNGWLAYTLSRSTRLIPPNGETLFDYDQTHAVTAVATLNLTENWSLSGRVRYTSGDPYTPTVGGFLDTDNDLYIPLRGAPFSLRQDAFFQVDGRADKKWIFKKWILWLYIDVQNVTNRMNSEQIVYSYNYAQQASITGLPFLPTFGLRAEF